MKKKNITLVAIPLLLASAATILASCGGNDKGDPNEVVFWHTFGAGNDAALKRKVESFQEVMKEQGKTVKITTQYAGGYGEIFSQISNGLAVGNNPTLAIAYPDHVAEYLEMEGSEHGKYVVNLQNYVSDSTIGFNKQTYLGDTADETDFVSEFYNEGKGYQREGLYSLPYMKSSEVLIYNQTQFQGVINALKLPIDDMDTYLNTVTWEDFMILCDTIQTAINNKQLPSELLEHVLGYDSDANLEITKLIQSDIGYAKVKTGSEKGEICFDPEVSSTKFGEAKAMISEFKSAYNKGTLITKGTNGTYLSDEFKNQKILFCVGSSGGAGYNFPTGVTWKVGVTKVPANKGHQRYVNQGLTLTFLNNSKYEASVNKSKLEIAWQFAKYITNPAQNVELCLDSAGYFPVRKSSVQTKEYQIFLNSSSDYAKTAKVLANQNFAYFTNADSAVFKGSAKLREQVGSMLTECLIAKSTGAALDAEIEKIMKDHINTAKTYM